MKMLRLHCILFGLFAGSFISIFAMQASYDLAQVPLSNEQLALEMQQAVKDLTDFECVMKGIHNYWKFRRSSCLAYAEKHKRDWSRYGCRKLARLWGRVWNVFDRYQVDLNTITTRDGRSLLQLAIDLGYRGSIQRLLELGVRICLYDYLRARDLTIKPGLDVIPRSNNQRETIATLLLEAVPLEDLES